MRNFRTVWFGICLLFGAGALATHADTIQQALGLLPSNNLSDLVNTITARLNLGTSYSNTVTLEDCGGGTAVADNTSAWSCAMTKADSFPYGARLKLGTGVYQFGSQITASITAGKTLTVEGDGYLASKLQYIGSTSLPLVYAGSASASNSNLILKNFGFRAPSNTSANLAGAEAILVYNRPGAILEGIGVEDGAYYQGITLTLSYAPKLSRLMIVGTKDSGLIVTADGTANNMSIRDSDFNSDGPTDSVPAAIIAGDSTGITANGIILDGDDFEGDWSSIRFSYVSGASIIGSYSENTNATPSTVPDITCTAACSNFVISGNWFGQQPVATTYANFTKSQITNNAFYNRTITFDASAHDVTFTNYALFGTASVTNAPPPNAPSFTNSWSSVGGGLGPAGYQRTAGGEVVFNGVITGGTAGTTAFNLPVGYRPFYTRELITTNGLTTGTSYGPCYVEIGNNGNVNIINATGGYCSLDGIRFVP